MIALLGHCIHGETRFLVYELMEQGSMENQLHGHSHGSSFTLDIRIKIALNVARALEFLYEHGNPPVVIHSYLKSSNVLLDSNFNAKLHQACFCYFMFGRLWNLLLENEKESKRKELCFDKCIFSIRVDALRRSDSHAAVAPICQSSSLGVDGSESRLCGEEPVGQHLSLPVAPFGLYNRIGETGELSKGRRTIA
ncbi:hypothetical protein Drorol1_Dr00021395 [Drosera rotundifolia]